MNSTISVIIPVYNVAPYLERCVKSVINQTYRDLQIILVDDGSTDGSGELCDALMKTDPRIIVIHQKNQGLSVARNSGLDKADGEWIAFLDSDDWLQLDAYEVLLSIAQNYKADIASGKSRIVYGDEDAIHENDSERIFQYDNISAIVIELQKIVSLRLEVWNKLWKKTVIGDIRFVPGQVSEDVHFDRLVFLKANKIVYIDKTIHNYLVGRPGSTNSTFKIARFCVFDEYNKFINDLQLRGCKEAVQVIQNIALRYLLNMYIEAVDKAQPQSIKKRIIDIFDIYYRPLCHTKYMESAFRVFSVSPKLYYMISKMKAKVIK